MSTATAASPVEHKIISTPSIVAQEPSSEAQAGEAPAGSSATAGDSAVLLQASFEGASRVRGRDESQGYLPTPSPAPSSTGSRRPSAAMFAPQDQDMYIDAESDTDSLSSADTDMADAARVLENRKTVLFPDLATTFPSSEHFFDACRTRLLCTLGTSIERYWSSDMSATVKCERRLDASRCPFTVRVLENEGVWSLEEEACVWEHSHGPQRDEAASEEGRRSEEGASSDGSEEDSEGDSEWEAARKGRLGIVVGGISGPWAAKTDSSLVRRLVKSRRDIFAKQRSCRHPVLVAQSQRAVDKLIAETSGNNLPRGAFGNYVRFCEAQGIPVFPMTPAVVALWLVDKCSTAGDGYFLTYSRLLLKIMHLAESGWSSSSTYRELLAFDPDSDAITDFLRERKPTGPTIKPNKKRRRSHASSTSSTALDTSASTSTASFFASDDEIVSSSPDRRARVLQIVPGLPRAGDAFSSSRDAYGAFVRAILPVYGIGVDRRTTPESMIIKCNRWSARRTPPGATPCPYRVEVKRDGHTGRWLVAEDVNEAQHSHGPAAQILRDPSWRPRVRSADARAALGMVALPSEGKLTRRGRAVQGRGKGKEVERARSRTKKRKVSTSGGKKRRVVKSSADHARRLARLGVAPSPQRRSPKPDIPTARHSPSTVDNAPAKPPPSAALPAPRPRPPSSSSAVDVEAFLLALHPSLAPLAPHLVYAGLDSTDALQALVALSPTLLDLFLDLVRAQPDGVAPGPPSVIQLKLLSRVLKEQGSAFRSL
ncbi:hypothetical protein JCM8208_007214 [Rhodotorula glutinis]